MPASLVVMVTHRVVFVSMATVRLCQGEGQEPAETFWPVPGSWFLVHGSLVPLFPGFLVLCFWFLVFGSWSLGTLVLCSWFQVPGSWFLGPSSWFLVPGPMIPWFSGLLVLCFWFLVPGSWFLVLSSWFLVLGSCVCICPVSWSTLKPRENWASLTFDF